MEMDTARAITHRIVGRANANWIKADRTSYAPGTLLCTETCFRVGDRQPKIRLLYAWGGWQATIADLVRRPTTRWQWFRRLLRLRYKSYCPGMTKYPIYASTWFPPDLEYIVFHPTEPVGPETKEGGCGND